MCVRSADGLDIFAVPVVQPAAASSTWLGSHERRCAYRVGVIAVNARNSRDEMGLIEVAEIGGDSGAQRPAGVELSECGLQPSHP